MSGMEIGKDHFLAGSILAAAVLVAGALVYTSGPVPAEKQLGAAGQGGQEVPTIADTDVILGDPNAPVTLVEYGDYQCPFCGRFFAQSQQKIVDNYVKTGKVKFVSKDIAFLGVESDLAAEAAQCAKEQGKFWQFHDEIFKREIIDGEENNGNMNTQFFVDIAGTLGMDAKKVEQCLDKRTYKSVIEANMLDAQRILGGQVSTPTIFVNGTMIRGAVPYEQFAAAIEAELAKAKK